MTGVFEVQLALRAKIILQYLEGKQIKDIVTSYDGIFSKKEILLRISTLSNRYPRQHLRNVIQNVLNRKLWAGNVEDTITYLRDLG